MGKGNYRVRIVKRKRVDSVFDVIKYFEDYYTAITYYEFVSGSNYIADISEKINMQWRVITRSCCGIFV